MTESEGVDREEGLDFLFEIVSIFLLVGFAFFLIEGSLVLGMRNNTPVTVVSSGSMDTNHDWWVEYEQMGYDSENFPFKEGFSVGDLVFVQGVTSVEDFEVGDVVIFWAEEGGQRIRVIHRVYDTFHDEGFIRAKGDDNPGPRPYEERITEEDIIGKAAGSIPYIGYPAYWLRIGL